MNPVQSQSLFSAFGWDLRPRELPASSALITRVRGSRAAAFVLAVLAEAVGLVHAQAPLLEQGAARRRGHRANRHVRLRADAAASERAAGRADRGNRQAPV